MADKNLKAIVLNGIGGRPFGENSVQRLALPAGIGKARAGGCLSVLEQIGLPSSAKKLTVKSMTGRLACYNCMLPCLAHLKVPGDRRVKKALNEGIVLLDHVGYSALARKQGREAVALMSACLRLGIDPAAAAAAIPDTAGLQEALSVIENAGLPVKTDEKRFHGDGPRIRRDIWIVWRRPSPF